MRCRAEERKEKYLSREERIEREREAKCADRCRRELLSTAIFPRILSPREYSLLTSIYLAATSTGSNATGRPPSRPRMLLCLSRVVVTVRENAGGTVLETKDVRIVD